MRSFVLNHGVIVGVAIACVGLAVFFIWNTLTRDPLIGLSLATVESGLVENIVSVSGQSESANTAELSFPTNGVVRDVLVKEGDTVEVGTILATLGTNKQLAGVERARADVAIAEASLSALKAGIRSEERLLTDTAVKNAEAELARIKDSQTLAIENATRAYLSTDLSARSLSSNEDAVSPIITGTYNCQKEGSYSLSIYSSNAESGYSINLNDLENGSYAVGTEQPAPFGKCGLFAQFDENSSYQNSKWIIEIPNPQSATYVTRKNALLSTKKTATDAIASAEEALTKVKQEQALVEAGTRSELIAEGDARVQQTRAVLAEALADVADRSIVAPFTGTVTTIDILSGETVGTLPVIGLLATSSFDIIARVPEIDITKIAVGQDARLVFDAKQDEIVKGQVTQIANLPTLTDGVAYFEVKITINTLPSWMRGGLNVDVDIITGSIEALSKIPSRYLISDKQNYFVRTLTGNSIATTTVTVTFIGNDGYVAITGLTPGATIVAP